MDGETKLTIVITSHPGANTARARIKGTNLSATCTAGEEEAVRAAVAKWLGKDKDRAVTLFKPDRGDNRTWYATLAPRAGAAPEFAVGDRVTFHIEGMPEEQPGTVTMVLGLGWMVADDRGHEPVMVLRARDYIKHAPPSAAGGTPAAPAMCGDGEPASAGAPASAPASAEPVDAPVHHDALADLTEDIRELIQTGRRSAVRIAQLIAEARQQFFPAQTQAQAWLDWAAKEFGYERRFCYECRKVGEFMGRRAYILPPAHRALLEQTDLYKIQYVAAIPPAHVQRFLNLHPDLPDMPRDDVRRLARAWAANRTPAELEAEEQRLAEERAERAQARAAAACVRKPVAALLELARLGAAAGETRAAIGAEVEAMTAVRAGFTALDVAIAAFAGAPPTDAQIAVIRELLAQFAAHLPNETAAAAAE